jgi:hypothetical protein
MKHVAVLSFLIEGPVGRIEGVCMEADFHAVAAPVQHEPIEQETDASGNIKLVFLCFVFEIELVRCRPNSTGRVGSLHLFRIGISARS